MDNIDVKIVNCLRQNARMSASEIAESVSLSISAVIERIKKLENTEVINGYTALINPQKINKDVIAIMSVSIEHPKYNQKFIQIVSNHSHIIQCYYIAGDYDFLLKIVTQNTRTLEKVLDEIKSIQGVAKTKTNIVLSTLKDDFTSPLFADESDLPNSCDNKSNK
ncbi:MAG: Lrp/AsnC family transcriptional regulator [Clostridia bacterium]